MTKKNTKREVIKPKSLLEDIKKRKSLLASIKKQVEKTLIASQKSKGKDPSSQAEKNYLKTMGFLSVLYDRYEKTLTKAKISRSPHDGELVSFLVDDQGLDGPFWDCDRPIRPTQKLPKTVFAYCGAINVETVAKEIDHEVKPGPGQPFLIPRFMQIEGMKAVISALKIGEFDAYMIFYFHEFPLFDEPRVNYWGTQYHIAEWQKEHSYLLNIPDYSEDFDFDILQYIKKGAAFWIAPGDSDLILRSTVFDYPFQNLEGRKFPARFVNGKILNNFQSL